MKVFLRKYYCKLCKRCRGKSCGSATVEAAVIFPMAMAVILFGYSCIVLCVNYFIVGLNFNKTAEQLSDYAYIYHEKIISNLSDSLKNGAKDEINGEIDKYLNKVPEEISGLFDLKGTVEKYENDLLDNGADQIYIPIAYGLFTMNMPDNKEYIRSVDFSGSDFFHDESNEIILNLKCKVKFPLAFFNNDGVRMTYKLKTKAWLNGIGKEEEPGEDIWSLNNFDRGKKIRKLYGANLPDSFPVIAAFRNNRAIMIKSVDYRKESYQATGVFSENVGGMLTELYKYNGQEAPYGKDNIVIKRTDIKERELILVIPDDIESDILKSEMAKVETKAKMCGIILTVKKLK